MLYGGNRVAHASVIPFNTVLSLTASRPFPLTISSSANAVKRAGPRALDDDFSIDVWRTYCNGFARFPSLTCFALLR